MSEAHCIYFQYLFRQVYFASEWEIWVLFIACKTCFMRNVLGQGRWNGGCFPFAVHQRLYVCLPSTVSPFAHKTINAQFRSISAFIYIEKKFWELSRNIRWNCLILIKLFTYFFRNWRSHNEQPNNRSGLCFVVDVELGPVDGRFAGTFFKWIRWMWSLRLALRVNFISQWLHLKIRSFVCNRKWHLREFLPNVRLHMGHGILLSLQISHLWSISWNMHSASVGVLVGGSAP